jgi:hypothetical protein
MLVRPEGLWPEEARRRELHAGDEVAIGPHEPAATQEPGV